MKRTAGVFRKKVTAGALNLSPLSPEAAMFFLLLIVTFIIAFAVSFVVVKVFSSPLDAILKRIIQDEICTAWLRYLKFAMYVVGISSGVRIYQLERYITQPDSKDSVIIELTTARWVLEVYRTVIGSLQGIAWMLLIFFVFALIAFVIVKIYETKREKLS